MRRAALARAASLAMLSSSCVLGVASLQPVWAQEDWKPFAEPERRRPPRSSAPAAGQMPSEPGRQPTLSPMDGVTALRRGPADPQPSAGRVPSGWTDSGQLRGTQAPRDPTQAAPLVERPTVIERSDLPAVVATDGSGLPHELWRGIDAASFEKLLAGLELPPRSPALHALWRRLITADLGPQASDADGQRFLALRLEALRRTGLVTEEAALLDRTGSADQPLIAAFRARSAVGLGDFDAGCAATKAALAQRATLPTQLRTELVLLAGACAAASKNNAATAIVADLAREEGLDAQSSLAVLDAIATGAKPRLTLPKQLSSTDYRLLELAGAADQPQLIERASPALLAALVMQSDGDAKLRLAAAEAAARLNVVTAEQLAEVWRAQAFQPQELSDPLGAKVDAHRRRALLFRAAEAERTPLKKTRIIRAFLDDSRRAGLYLPASSLIAQQVALITPAQEIGWFAETAIEAHLAERNFERVRTWATVPGASDGAGGGGLQQWLALADIADERMRGPRGSSLGSVEALALRGRYSADLLHRLATVLDALDYQVPMALWEAASRTPQPTTGHLPPTGVLSELQDAAKQRELGRTVLLAMQTLGPTGGEGAHMIALGDAIRALKRAGLEAEARRLAFEALFAGWPRSISQ